LTFSHYAQESSRGVKILAGAADFFNPLSILKDAADIAQEIQR
jgi:hypothetical protein